MTLPTWAPAGEHKPAPMPLLLVQAFVNTRDLDRGTDLLAEPAQANEWLHESGLLARGNTAGADDLGVARDVREGIRALLAHNAQGTAPSSDDLRPLEALARLAQPRLTIGPDGQVQLHSERGGRLADGLLDLLLIIRDAQQDGTWRRLKSCGNTECRWAFFDRSHSHQGAWCDMASCGNMIKNRNLRARRAGRESAAPPAPHPGAR